MPAETGKPPFSDRVAIIRALLLAQNGWRDCLAPADRDQAGRSLRNGLQREPFRVDLSHGVKPNLAQHGDGVLRLSDLDGTIPQASHGSRAALLLTGTKPGTRHWHQ